MGECLYDNKRKKEREKERFYMCILEIGGVYDNERKKVGEREKEFRVRASMI